MSIECKNLNRKMSKFTKCTTSLSIEFIEEASNLFVPTFQVFKDLKNKPPWINQSLKYLIRDKKIFEIQELFMQIERFSFKERIQIAM